MNFWLISRALVTVFSSCQCNPSVQILLCWLLLRAELGTFSPDVIIIIAPRLARNRTYYLFRK